VTLSAWVEHDLRCPDCNELIDDAVWLPWGGVMSSNFSYGPVYRVGSRLLWFVDDEGRAPGNMSWPYRATNLGVPTIADVDVFSENLPTACPRCEHPIGAVVVSIRSFVISGVSVVSHRGADADVRAIVRDPGTMKPLDELRDIDIRHMGGGRSQR
jgi:hypothetical protein